MSEWIWEEMQLEDDLFCLDIVHLMKQTEKTSAL